MYLGEEVLSQIRNALLGENHVGFHADDVLADLLNVLLLELQIFREILFLADLDVRLPIPQQMINQQTNLIHKKSKRKITYHGFALLVLQIAVQEQNFRVLNPPAHLVGETNVLVEHGAGHEVGVLDAPARDLLDLDEVLDVHLGGASLSLGCDHLHGLHGHLASQLGPARHYLRPDARGNDLGDLVLVVHLHRNARNTLKWFFNQ